MIEEALIYGQLHYGLHIPKVVLPISELALSLHLQFLLMVRLDAQKKLCDFLDRERERSVPHYKFGLYIRGVES